MEVKYHACNANVPVGTVLKENAVEGPLYVAHFGASWGPFTDGRSYDEGIYYPHGYRSKEVRGEGTLDSLYCRTIAESVGYPAKRLNGVIHYKRNGEWVKA